jgi:tetratricopeptide (TPR) repeat protein
MHAHEAQKLSQLSSDLYSEAEAQRIVAMCSILLGDYQSSIVQLKSAKQILGLCGMSGGLLDSEITTSQAEVHLLKSEYAEAGRTYTQIIRETSLGQNPGAYACAELNLAEIGIITGATEQDVRNALDQAKKGFDIQNTCSGHIHCDVVLAHLNLREKNTLSAYSLFHKSLHSSLGTNHEAVSYCLEKLADITQWTDSSHSKLTWPIVYLGYAHKFNEKLAIYKALLFLGDVFNSYMHEDTACTLYNVALEGFTYIDVHRNRAQCMLRLGDLAEKKDDFSKATEYWNTARPLFERSLLTKDVNEIDARLVAIEETRQKALGCLTTLHVPTTFLENISNSENTMRKEVEENAGEYVPSQMIA